jgi:hypothetical protein
VWPRKRPSHDPQRSPGPPTAQPHRPHHRLTATRIPESLSLGQLGPGTYLRNKIRSWSIACLPPTLRAFCQGQRSSRPSSLCSSPFSSPDSVRCPSAPLTQPTASPPPTVAPTAGSPAFCRKEPARHSAAIFLGSRRQGEEMHAMRRKSKDEQQKESKNGEVELADMDHVDWGMIWNRGQ